MLFDIAFNSQLKPAPPRILPNLNLYINSLGREVLYNLHKYSVAPARPNRSDILLVSILGSLPIDDMMKIKDPYKRYSLLTSKVIEDATRSFNPAYLKDSRINLNFCCTPDDESGIEYLLPVKCKNGKSDLPLGLGWNAWKRMRPFRIGMIDTHQLSLYAYLDKLIYTTPHPPLITVYCLNTPMFAMQYCAYLDSLSKIKSSTDDVYSYLHQYVLFPALINDNTNLWLRNQYWERLVALLNHEGGLIHTPFEDNMWKAVPDGRLGAQYPQFLQNVDDLTTMFIKKTIYPDVYLSSCLLLSQVPMLTYFRSFLQFNDVPQLRQYSWIEYLRDWQWIDFLTLALSWNKQWVLYTYFKSYFNRCLRLFQESHPWTDCENHIVETFIANKVKEQLKLVDQKDVNLPLDQH